MQAQQIAFGFFDREEDECVESCVFKKCCKKYKKANKKKCKSCPKR